MYNIWVEDVQLSNEWCADFPPYYYWIISSIQPFQLLPKLKGLKALIPSQNIPETGYKKAPSADIHFWQGICAEFRKLEAEFHSPPRWMSLSPEMKVGGISAYLNYHWIVVHLRLKCCTRIKQLKYLQPLSPILIGEYSFRCLIHFWCADFPPYYYWIISSIQPFQLRSQMPCQKWISAG